MGIGARIGELAKSKKISLKELSRRIDIPYTTLYHMVSRDSKVDLDTASKIADVLSIDINWLLNGYTLEEHNEEFIQRLQGKGDVSARDLYLKKHSDDEPAPAKEKAPQSDVDRLMEGLNAESIRKLREYAELLLLGQDAQTAPTVPDDKEPAEK